MNDIIKAAKAEASKLEKLLKKIDTFLCDAPGGCLKWQNKNGKTYYYKQYRKSDGTIQAEAGVSEEQIKDSNKWGRKYIKKEEMVLAKLLAQKHYYSLAKPIVEKQLDILEQFIKKYPDNELEESYDALSIERKSLIAPLYPSAKELVKQWEEEVYEQTTMYPENLKFETEQGELVRSKSEVIIANILYQNHKQLLYKYERQLQVIAEGKPKTIYPDFTIINIDTGRIVYWEHAGRMDDSYYTNEFVKKINMYVANGLLPGRDVILTFESQENPLDIGVVKKLVKSLT